VTGRSSGIPLALGAAGLLVAAAALRRGSGNQPGRVRVEVLLDPVRGGAVASRDALLRVAWQGDDGEDRSVLVRGGALGRTGALDGVRGDDRAHVARQLEAFASWAQGLRFPLALYRGLGLRAGQDYEAGHPEVQSWSTDERVALRFAREGLSSGKDKMQLLQSESISPDRVAWLDTLGFFLQYSAGEDEGEYEIVPNGDLRVVRVQEIVQRPGLLTARGSRSDAGRVRVYHGTADLGAASSILRQSKIRVRTEASRHYSAPLPGRAYVARELSEALMYTFGGFTWTAGGSGEIKTCGPNEKGALIVLEADEADCVPDEDWLGMIALRLICEPGRRGPPKQTPTWRGRPVEQETRLRVLDAVDLCPSRSVQAWRRIRCWPDQDIESRTGKAMINHLLKTKKGRALLQALAVLSPNLACLPSGLRVVGAYEVSKSALPHLRPDGSNLHEVATPVSP